MKKIGLIFFLVIGFCCTGAAQTSRTARGLSESEQLGVTAGAALACNAGGKLDDFELIASRIIANQAPTAAAEKEEYTRYATYKLKTYREQKSNPQMTCGEVLETFNRLPIFRSVVYADGGVKMPNGKMLKPIRPVVQPAKQKTKAAPKQKQTTPKQVRRAPQKQYQAAAPKRMKPIAVRPVKKR